LNRLRLVMTIKKFTRQITPIKDRLYRFAMRMVDNAAEAEDVVQEVLIKLWHKREELSQIQNLEAWSIRLTRNLSLDKLRSKHKRTEGLDEHYNLVSDTKNPAQIIESKDAMQRIQQLMQALPESQRLVLQLRDIEELSYKEIAESLDMSMNLVKVNLFRGRQNLKAILTKNEPHGL